MKENQKRVLKAIYEDGGESNSREVRRRTGYSNDTVRSVTGILRRKDYIEIDNQAVEVEDQSNNLNKYTLTEDGWEEVEELGELVAQAEMAAEIEVLRKRVSALEEAVGENEESVNSLEDNMEDVITVINHLTEKDG